MYMGWIAALISTSVLVILWFWEVRRRLREQHSMVESARSQMDSCRRRAAGSSGDADAAQVLRRCEDIYRQAAEQGDRTGQCNLGYLYETGVGVTKSWKEAVLWYRKAAEQELPRAQYNLAWCYENAKGVELDYGEAARLYRTAAEQG